MHSIVLKDGKIININAAVVEWDIACKTIRLFDKHGEAVARINMDNAVGWIKTDNIVASEVPNATNT